MAHIRQSTKTLLGKRVLVCGKGGSGKSTIVAMMAAVLHRKGYEVMVLDGDASNPEGLIRLLFGLGVEGEPKPLVEFFGGIGVVTCPVDDPSPLTRINDSNPVSQNRIDIRKEVPPEYYLQKGSMILLLVGKIETYGQGCDGPLESVSIAKRMVEFCRDGGIENIWLILNKIGSDEVKSMLINKLENLQGKVIGSIPYDEELVKAGLSENSLGECRVLEQVGHIVERLEQAVSFRGRNRNG